MRPIALAMILVLIITFRPFDGFGADEGQTAQDAAPAPPLSISVSVEPIAKAKISDLSGSVAATETSAGLSWLFLMLDFNQRRNDWQVSSDTGIAAAPDPWGTLTQVSPGLQYYRTFGDRWGIWPKLTAIAGFEDGLSSESWTYNPQLIGLYMPRAQLTLYFGAGMLYHPVDATVYPVMGLAWNMDATRGLSGAVGFPETMLQYQVNDRLALKADFQWDIRLYRLADDNALAPGGYLKTVDLKPAGYLQLRPTESLEITAGIRRWLGRSLTVFDRSERKLTESAVDATTSFQLSIDHQF
jgi:hypothetical protein